jgi:hypothetical protein
MILAVFAAVAVLAAIGVYAFFRTAGPELPAIRLPVGPACVVAAPVGASPSAASSSTAPAEPVTLDSHQMANAATIAAVGIRRGVPRRAVVVALATAFQESKLENLPGGDRDSIGLFQQRPSQGWGRPDQISDPRYAANRFYTALLKVRNWQKMRVTEAAQAVQRSAYPEYYEKWAGKSDVLASALIGEATGAVGCTISADPPSRGVAAADTLIASMRLDWGDVKHTAAPGMFGIVVTAPNDRVGWQYAHWLVSHAEDRGVKRVRFGNLEWTAKTGTWTRVTDSAGPASGRVVAEVHEE